MQEAEKVTRAQTKFLRGFVANPYGPPVDQWPSPVILRRWLKRPGFCGAMNSILRALRYQADFHLTAAAASGAHLLHGTVHGGDVIEARKHIEALIHLMRMNHIRQRFAEPLPQPKPNDRDLIGILRMAHPSLTVEHALKLFDRMQARHREPGHRRIGRSSWKKAGQPFTEEWGDEQEEPDCDRGDD